MAEPQGILSRENSGLFRQGGRKLNFPYCTHQYRILGSTSLIFRDRFEISRRENIWVEQWI